MVRRILDRAVLKEQGVESIEFIFTFPILILMMLFIIQACLWGYWSMALNGQVEHGTWNLTATELSQIQSGSSRGEAVVKEKIAQGSSLDSSLMSVSDVQVTSGGNSASEATRYSDGSDYGITTMTRDTSTKHVKARVTYRCPSFFVLAPEITIERQIDHTVIENDRIEVR